MGLARFPLQVLVQNQIWCQIIQLASDPVAWEPKRRARLFEIPATLVRRCRHKVRHLARHAPEALTVLTGVNRLRAAVAET